jgi:hypothetical protein
MHAFILAAAIAASPCANPSIVSAIVQSVTAKGVLNHYTIAIAVRNLGNVRQPSNLLQSIEVLQDDQPVDRIGLQPLRPNQSQKVTYGFDRAADAGDGTTALVFTIDLNGRTGSDVDCHGGVESFTLHV